MKDEGGLKLDIRKDTIWFIQLLVFLVFAAAAPFRLLWTPFGWIGKRSFGLTDFVGLAIILPLFGQWPSSPADARWFNLAWLGFWILLLLHAATAARGNRIHRVHSQDIGSRAWVGSPRNPIWPLALVSLPALMFVGDACVGLTLYLCAGPAFHAISFAIVDAKMNREAEEVSDAMIAAEEAAARIRHIQQRQGRR